MSSGTPGSRKDGWFGLLGLNASATARVISRRWNDDEMLISLVEAPRMVVHSGGATGLREHPPGQKFGLLLVSSQFTSYKMYNIIVSIDV